MKINNFDADKVLFLVCQGCLEYVKQRKKCPSCDFAQLLQSKKIPLEDAVVSNTYSADTFHM